MGEKVRELLNFYMNILNSQKKEIKEDTSRQQRRSTAFTIIGVEQPSRIVKLDLVACTID